MNCFKRVPLEHMDHCRDMGGYGCEEGGFFPYHKLYRADAPDRLSIEEWELLITLGVRTVIDLRSHSERKLMPYTAPEGVAVLHLPFQKSDIDLSKTEALEQMAKQAFGKSLTQVYEQMLFSGLEQVAGVLDAVAEGLKSGAVLFHCTIGKDRTGILAAILYTVCGVSSADIIADYQVSETYLSQNQRLQQLIREETRALLASKPETMHTLLQVMQQRDFFSMLAAEGFDRERQQELKKAILY